MNVRWVTLFICTIWILPSLLYIPSIFIKQQFFDDDDEWSSPPSGKTRLCHAHFRTNFFWTLAVTCFNFWFVLITLTVLYVKIYKVTKFFWNRRSARSIPASPSRRLAEQSGSHRGSKQGESSSQLELAGLKNPMSSNNGLNIEVEGQKYPKFKRVSQSEEVLSRSRFAKRISNESAKIRAALENSRLNNALKDSDASLNIIANGKGCSRRNSKKLEVGSFNVTEQTSNNLLSCESRPCDNLDFPHFSVSRKYSDAGNNGSNQQTASTSALYGSGSNNPTAPCQKRRNSNNRSNTKLEEKRLNKFLTKGKTGSICLGVPRSDSKTFRRHSSACAGEVPTVVITSPRSPSFQETRMKIKRISEALLRFPMQLVENLTEQKTSMRILTAIMTSFVLFWSPNSIISTIYSIDENLLDMKIVDIGYYLCYITSLINPIVYTCANVAFKDTFRQMLKCHEENNTSVFCFRKKITAPLPLNKTSRQTSRVWLKCDWYEQTFHRGTSK